VRSRANKKAKAGGKERHSGVGQKLLI
jgi:hypothetical protein